MGNPLHLPLNQGGTTKFRKAFVPVSGRRLFYWQDAETGFQLCSRLENILNVPQRVRFRCFLRLRPCWKTCLSNLQDRGGVP